jgi:hypothetical protein
MVVPEIVLAPERVPNKVVPEMLPVVIMLFAPLTEPYKGPTKVVPVIVVPEMVFAPLTEP